MSLEDFIKKFVEPNTLIRLWYKNSEGGHTFVINSEKDPVSMEHEILKGEGIYGSYNNRVVKGVTDILVTGNYTEAVNIVIERLVETNLT